MLNAKKINRVEPYPPEENVSEWPAFETRRRSKKRGRGEGYPVSQPLRNKVKRVHQKKTNLRRVRRAEAKKNGAPKGRDSNT